MKVVRLVRFSKGSLSSLETGIDANRKKNGYINLLIGPLVKFSRKGETKMEDMRIFTHHFCGRSQENPHPNWSDLSRLKTWLFWGLKHHCIIQVQFTRNHWRVQSLILRAPKKSYTYFMCESNRSKPDDFHHNPRVFVACEPMKAPDAGGWIFMERKSTRNCHLFCDKDIYLCRISYNTLVSLQGVVFMVTKSNFNHLRFW